jgi:hypothetical protein
MTQDEIIAMAKQAGFDTDLPAYENGAALAIKLALLVAAKEREACAKVCDELHWPWHIGDDSGPKQCAIAIRARGEQA